jgi:hypothetical protein
MTATSHANWGANTEALEVAKAFADAIRGKTVMVTGVNRRGIGFTTAQAFVSCSANVPERTTLTTPTGLAKASSCHHYR